MNQGKILIVDDNRDFLSELRETLFLCGYEVAVAAESSVVCKLAQSMQPDVILLDLKMSEMNGFNVAEQLHRENETSRIPIIAMSGYFPIESSSNLLDMSNMAGCIKKPFSMFDLITQLERAIKNNCPKTGS
ncbi:MAG: response regulator [Candidatus Omnitrophica bacterium]|nr:response regulator [Candidatus Omnitrophota bacterium]